MSWWLEKTAKEVDPEGLVIVLDADTRIEAAFIERLVQAFHPAVAVAQVRIEPLYSSDSHVAVLAAFSEKVEQHVFDVLRARWGWPVRLRGTGMAFRRTALDAIAGDLRTSVEDIELTILALRAGYLIQWIDSTCIFDPKPMSTSGAARQRARWLKGQLEILRRYWPALLRLMIGGAGSMTLVASLLLKPRTLFLPLKAITAALLTVGGTQVSHRWAWLLLPAGLLWFNVAFEVLAFVVGLRYMDNPWQTVKALLRSPLYGWMWLRSAVLAVFSREAWLRGREH
jgi:cellulose synthase/poly-beta-1,6-N-acetylglucosamine synthase-like glycosyltransferase